MSRPSPVRFFGRVVAACILLITFAAAAQAAGGPAPFQATFPKSASKVYVSGSNQPIRFELRGQRPANGDVLVLVWSTEQGRMLDDFAHLVQAEPWQISAEKLESLPPGRYQLQLMSRVDYRIRAQDTLWITKVNSAAGKTDLQPNIAFQNPPATYSRGSGVDIAFSVSNLPNRPDVVVQAWSPQQNRLVGVFAHSLTDKPWRVSAAKLDLLPAGPVELQLLLRSNYKVVRIVKHTIRVSAPAEPNAEPETEPETTPEADAEPVASPQPEPIEEPVEEPVVVEPDPVVEPVTDPVVVEPDPVVVDPEPAVDPEPIVDSDPEPKLDPEPTVEAEPFSVAFASNMPSLYRKGSGAGVDVVVQGSLGDDTDILAIAWSTAQNRMVDAFAHPLRDPWKISSTQLDKLPDGSAELQLLIRKDYKVQQIVRRWIIVQPASTATTDGDGGDQVTETTPAQPDDGETGGDAQEPTDPILADGGSGADTPTTEQPQEPTSETDPLDDKVAQTPAPDTGWTTFTKSADTRVIYVSSSIGDDDNDGLTPKTPVKTPVRGFELMRDGYPDHLLFRRGDTFSLPAEGFDRFRRWKKSGRSKDAPMVVASYGDEQAALPLFLTNGNGFMRPGWWDGDVRHLVIADLHALANTRKPGHPDYRGGNSEETGLYLSALGLHDVRFEGLVIEYFHTNVLITRGDEQDIADITFRRCVIRNAWTSGSSHTQGFYAASISGLKLIECVFDHNGWLEDKHRNWFRHQVYLSDVRGARIEGCVFARESFLALKVRGHAADSSGDIVIRDNLFFDSLYPIAVSGDPIYADQSGILHQGVTITGNVFTRIGGSLPNATTFATVLAIEQADDVLIEGNYLLHRAEGAPDGRAAMEIGGGKPHGKMVVRGNVITDWSGEGTEVIKAKAFAGQESLIIKESNQIGLPTDRYVDGQRSLADYYQQVAGCASPGDLVEAMVDQTRYHWRGELAIPNIVRWFKQGYELRPFD